MLLVHEQGSAVSIAVLLLSAVSSAVVLPAAFFLKALPAQAAAVPHCRQRCLCASLPAADLNEKVPTNPSGFPTRTMKKVTATLNADLAREALRGAVEVLLQNTEHRWRHVHSFQRQLSAWMRQGGVTN